jgi:uncharacterized membrane protein
MLKKILYVLVLSIVGISFVLISRFVFLRTPTSPQENASHEVYEVALVLELEDKNKNEETHLHEQKVTLRLLSGEYKGQEIRTTHHFSGVPGLDLDIQKGDKVVLYIESKQGELENIYISDMYRIDWTLAIIILFVLLLLIIGGWKGFKSLIALGITILSIFEILIPSIVIGYNPLLVTIFISTFVTIFTMLMIADFSTKSIAATLGTISGVVVAGFLAIGVGYLTHLTGISSEESRAILLSPTLSVDLKGLLFAGILIGAIGAIMDVSMSISSSIHEIYKANPKSNLKSLFSSGMNVGRDIMGTMSNTLILAYTGGALPLLFMYSAYKVSFMKILNLELITTEILRAVVGSIGLIMSVPLTSFIASLLLILFVSKMHTLDVKTTIE